MKILNLIYFSPTGTTRKVVSTIGRELGITKINEYNLAPANQSEVVPKIDKNSLTIIGVPVYSGRLPLVIVEELEKLKGNNTPVVLVVVYGNRAFEDALLELKEITGKCGFTTIAGAAFVGEHSYSTNEKPIALNRPDEEDLLKCQEFAKLIQNKIEGVSDNGNTSELSIPGNTPYRERSPRPLLVPETIEENCDKCTICAEVCPTNAITINSEVVTDKDLCIWCCACVKSCPQGARIFDNPTVNGIADKLTMMCKERKEPEFFL